MTKEKAWELICGQFEREKKLIIQIGVAFLLLLTGCSVIVISRIAGIVIILCGAVFMTYVTKSSAKNSVDSDLLYRKYFLTEWLNDYFEDVQFSTKNAFSAQELDENWTHVTNSREFSGYYKGIKFRAAQIFTGNYTNPKIGEDMDEGIFEGRVWELEGILQLKAPDECYIVKHIENRTILLHNLYSISGPCNYWMPAPTKEMCDLDNLKKSVCDEIREYLQIFDSAL